MKQNFVVGIPCGNSISQGLVKFIVNNKIQNIIIEPGYWLIKNRNKIIKKFLKEHKEDYLIFLDSDIVPKMEWIDLVIKNKFDVVGIPYPIGRLIVSCMNTETNKWYTFEEYRKLIGKYCFKETKLVDAGCIIIHRKVLEKIDEPYWENPPEDYIITEALKFCYKIQTNGFKIYSLIGALCSHYKENIDLAEFVLENEKKEIPKTIHQIWIGSKKVPCKSQRENIKKMHSDWKYILWNKERLIKEGMITKLLYEKLIRKSPRTNQRRSTKSAKMRRSRSPYIKISDIARYNILKKYGGVYIDIDMICLKPLDDLIKGNEFFAGFEGEDRVSGLIGNSIIGCIPNHKAMINCGERLKEIPNQILSEEAVFATGPILFTEELAKCQNITIFSNEIFFPILFEKDVKKELNKKNNPLFENSYFIHPWGFEYEKNDPKINA